MNDLAFRELARQAANDSENVSRVIADYLMSIGDPKGELISLEHEINRMLNHPHKNLKQNQARLSRLQKEKEELIGNTDVELPLYLPQFYLNGNYDTKKGDTYAEGVRKLRKHLEDKKSQVHPRFKLNKGKSIYRPLTLEESVEARVVNYWTLKNPDGSLRTEEERRELFNDYQDSCTGIAYQKDSTKFKIDLECEKLIKIEEDSNRAYLPIDYANFSGEPLDSKNGIYNNFLTFQQFMEQPGHTVAIPDKTLRRAFGEIVFAERDNEPSLGFYILDPHEIEEDQLRALYVYLLDVGSGVDGRFDLDNDVHFLRVAQMESERSEV